MVTEIRLGRRKIFSCGECGLPFADSRTAKMCENYCKAHKACDPGIAARAIRGKLRGSN